MGAAIMATEHGLAPKGIDQLLANQPVGPTRP